ncbi:MAG: hypothetical protein LBS69_06180 [Prevotellaceae bacterium]|jgi:hypothetical protein|nr:hypothetical protein [Prevotellaceae bacterium]
MKRAIALTFLLLANIIMLAHIFVPHCDYNKISATAPLSVIQSENDSHCCSCEDFHHSHDTDMECLLSQIYARLENNDKTTTLADFILLSYPFVSVNDSVPTINAESLSFHYKPYLLSYYCAFIFPTIGLRAPPAC